ncbi:SWIM zinc finger family protein [Streptomyces sp. NPDC048297]|uniref:SWIM zinc finger family protein n=1 Tax=Streptomyces sp. NPDC048297 TaxID=3365531 RepID=UPI0037101B6D
MTTGTPRPADAARRALRAARERAETDREADSAEQSAACPAEVKSGSGAVAREALRAAVAARSARRDEADVDGPRTAGTAGAAGTSGAAGAERAVGAVGGAATGREDESLADGPTADESKADESEADESMADDAADGRPRGQQDIRTSTSDGSPTEAVRTSTDDTSGPGIRPEPSAGEAPSAGSRPGDVAREALRAARRQALLAESEAAKPDDRRSRRTGARPAAAHPGEESRTPRSQAAHDMRQFLATAFRMPSGTDSPEGLGDRGEADRGEADTRDAGTFADATTRMAPHSPASTREPGTKAPAPGVRASTAPGGVSPAPAPALPHVPAPPHVPATMATPHRDTELRRTFPAFRARQAFAEGAGAVFAESWWGNAWVEALEQGALDAKRLGRGRGYADGGNVDSITVTPGLVLAYVRGSRPRPYRVQVRLRTLEDADWERFLDTAADRPGHIAALLDKELPQSLADCGVPLLPGPGDLDPHCSCPDSGHPCKHAAALCYQTARLLDADPFVLLLLRGRGERQLLDALSRRSAARAARAAQEGQPGALPGIRASQALTPRQLPPLPLPLPAPPHPEQPPVYPAAPGGPDPFALDQLATDAAARAHALLTTGRDPVGELTLWQDAVRLAAARPGSGLTATTRTLYATLATATGRTTADLARAVAAWRQGGLAGLTVLEEPWDPPAGRFDRARPLLLAADLPAFRPWRNHLTHPRGHVQLRLGRDGLWYAYESDPGHDDWWPRSTPDLDPIGALTGLDTASDL